MLRQAHLYVVVIVAASVLVFLFLLPFTSIYLSVPSMPTASFKWIPPLSAGILSTPLPRVLCWVNTHPPNHAKKAVHVRATWGKRCDKLLFMSTEADDDLGAVALQNITSGRASLWNKTRAAFTYVWEKHREEADWFIKADDDTYVIMENLKHLLVEYDSDRPMIFGHRFKYFGGYMAGGSGYVLSKAALDLFVSEVGNPKKCLDPGFEWGGEDVRMGQCMTKLNVTVGDSRDSGGRARFMIWNPREHLIPRKGKKRWRIFLLQQISRGQRNQMLQRLSDIIPLRPTRHDVCSRVPHLPCQSYRSTRGT